MRATRFALILVLCLATVFAQQSAPASGIGLLEAVRSTWQLHPLLQVSQKQVDISRAIKQQRSAEFDTLLDGVVNQSRLNVPLTGVERFIAQQAGFNAENQATNLTTVSGSAQRLLRSGIVIGPRLELTRTTDNLQLGDGANLTRLSFDVTVPLRRGKGRDVVTAPETAAQFDIEGSLLDLSQTVADLTLSTATRYWQYRAALDQLDIVTGSETRGREFLDSVRTLITADKLPRSEINQVQANFASRSAGRFAVEQSVVEARTNLALAMGLSPNDLVDLPRPADAFPEGDSAGAPDISAAGMRAQIDAALRHRADYLSAEKKKQSADVLRKSSRNGLQPKLDLTLSSGYSGLHEGRRPDEYLASPFTNAHGPDLVLGLHYSFPHGNNLAAGRVAETEANYQQAVLSSAEKARVIAAAVTNTLVAVQSSIQRLRTTREAVAGYQKALEGERDKLRLGVGSLTDMLTVEGRLTDALLDRVNAQLAYAFALVQFRYASGTLIASGGADPALERDAFYTLPSRSGAE